MFVHANAACSIDLRVAGPGGAQVRLSGEDDWARVHRLRSESDAVLVGVGTVLSDDPRLSARPDGEPATSQPLRVVLDSDLRTPAGSRVCDGSAATLILTTDDRDPPDGVEAHCVDPDEGGRVDPAAALRVLADRGVGTVLVEGGPTVHRSFLAADLVDVLTVFVAPRRLGEGPFLFARPIDADPLYGLRLRSTRRVDDGVLFEWGREAPD